MIRLVRLGLLGGAIKSPFKAAAEAIQNDELTRHLDAMTDHRVMLKLTIPDQADLYEALTRHARVERVVALSGGYKLDDACERLRRNHGMVASFSRALIDDLKRGMNDAEFDATWAAAIHKIYLGSTLKG